MTIKTKTEAVKYHYSEAKDAARRAPFTAKFIASQEDRRGKLTKAVYRDLTDFVNGSKSLIENVKKSNLYDDNDTVATPRNPQLNAMIENLENIRKESNLDLRKGEVPNPGLIAGISSILERDGAQLAKDLQEDPRKVMDTMVYLYTKVLSNIDASYGELSPFFSTVRTANSLIQKQSAVKFHRGPRSMFMETDEKKLLEKADYINANASKIQRQMTMLKLAEAYLDMVTAVRNAMKDGDYAKAKSVAAGYHEMYKENESKVAVPKAEEDTLEMAGREETAIVGLRKLKDEIAGDISALKGYKDGTIKDDPGITNKDVNMKMYRLFIVGHALVHALNEEQKSAISDDRKKSLENLKIQTEIELTRANQMIKDAQGMLGKGKSLNMAKFREADSGLVALVSGFLRAEEAREADLKSSIEDKLRSLSRLMGIPAIRIDDAISKAIDDMVSMKASLRDKSVFGSTDYIETLA